MPPVFACQFSACCLNLTLYQLTAAVPPDTPSAHKTTETEQGRKTVPLIDENAVSAVHIERDVVFIAHSSGIPCCVCSAICNLLSLLLPSVDGNLL